MKSQKLSTTSVMLRLATVMVFGLLTVVAVVHKEWTEAIFWGLAYAWQVTTNRRDTAA